MLIYIYISSHFVAFPYSSLFPDETKKMDLGRRGVEIVSDFFREPGAPGRAPGHPQRILRHPQAGPPAILSASSGILEEPVP